MNRSMTVNHDHLSQGGNDDDTVDRVRCAGTKSHAVVPCSLRLGEVVSAGSAEKIPFDLKLGDGRTLRGRIALRIVLEDSLVKIYPNVIILGVEHARG